MEKRQMPGHVGGIVALQVIGGITATIVGAFFLILGFSTFMGTTGYPLSLAFGQTEIGGIFLAFGLLFDATGWGMWNGKKWAWTASVATNLIGAIILLVVLFDGDWAYGVPLVSTTVILYYLMRGDVKDYFRKST